MYAAPNESRWSQGYDHDAPHTLGGLACAAFQELATRMAHRNSGRYFDDPVADRIMVPISSGADRMSRYNNYVGLLVGGSMH